MNKLMLVILCMATPIFAGGKRRTSSPKQETPDAPPRPSAARDAKGKADAAAAQPLRKRIPSEVIDKRLESIRNLSVDNDDLIRQLGGFLLVGWRDFNEDQKAIALSMFAGLSTRKQQEALTLWDSEMGVPAGTLSFFRGSESYCVEGSCVMPDTAK